VNAREDGGITWYLCTCGVQVEAGFEWLAVTPGADPDVADADVLKPVAGCSPGEITDDARPSLLLGRRGPGWVLYVGGLRPRHVPEGTHRPIRATLLGLAEAGADPEPLLGVARLALLDRLADELPVDWPDKRPKIIDRPWPPAATAWESDGDETRPAGSATQAPDLRRSVGYPDTDRRQACADLARLSAADLETLSEERPLFLRSEVVGPQRLSQLRPWRASSNRLARRTEWPDLEGKTRVRAHSSSAGHRGAHPAGGAVGPAAVAGTLEPAESRTDPRGGAGDERMAQAGDSARGEGGRGERGALGRGAVFALGFVLGAALASGVWLAVYYFAVKGYRFR
jgi:hypothetical protein